jgi:Na+-translocating ferredoxin:NAD+ oxidoreductase RNF subunit RnfB
MITYVVPVLIFLAVGGAAGVALTLASRALSVVADEAVVNILACLPGINCGACGASSCEAYAEAVKAGALAPNLCKPGGNESAQGIGEVLGIEVTMSERETAFVHCSGVTTEDKFTYSGTPSCWAARRYYNGKGNCTSGCLGFGDCKAICAYDAVSFNERGAAVIDRHRCWACGLCVTACPNNLITLRKHSERVKVLCSSRDNLRQTKSNCLHGCIGCGACAKKCLRDAIAVKDNYALIDYETCTSCGVCAIICPTKCISVEEFYHKRQSE